MIKNVLVTGSWDLLHSGHVYFLQRAAEYGRLYVGVGPDKSIEQMKSRPTICKQDERLFMIRALKCVHQAWINSGMGPFDFFNDVPVNINMLIVNKDQDFPEKKDYCIKHGIEYLVFDDKQCPWLPERSATQMREYVNLRQW